MIKQLTHDGKTHLDCTVEQLRDLGVPAAVIDTALAAAALEAAAASRRAAYAVESDPLYMEWQYDQTAEAEQAWRDKVAEIKARYPLPAEA